MPTSEKREQRLNRRTLLGGIAGGAAAATAKMSELRAAAPVSGRSIAQPRSAQNAKLVMIGTPQGDPFWSQIIPAFKVKTGIEIQSSSRPREEFDAQYKAARAANAQIDLVALEPQFFLDYYKNGFLQDLGGILDNPQYPNLKRTDFLAGVLDWKSIAGKPYTVPYNLVMTLLYYNKDLYSKYGIEPAKTYEDYEEIKAKITDRSVSPLMIPAKDIFWLPMEFFNLISPLSDNNATQFSIDTILGKIKWTDPVYMQAGTIFKSWWDKGIIGQNTLGIDYNGLAAAFVQGQGSTVYQGSWFYVEGVKKVATPDFPLDVFAVPGVNGKKGQPNGVADVELSVDTSSQHKDEAYAFIDFAALPENRKLLASLGYIPSFKDTPPADPVMAKAVGLYKDTTIQLFLDHIWEPQITQGFQVQLQKLAAGATDVGGMLKDIQSIHDGLVKDGKSNRAVFSG